ncbi:MAG: PQQ-binding-like beta-propeller repeat protein [Rubrivivax sp.]|nr:PQQ-binding-like beta-propeller repeat protein [Rubrivivax sp.]
MRRRRLGLGLRLVLNGPLLNLLRSAMSRGMPRVLIATVALGSAATAFAQTQFRGGPAHAGVYASQAPRTMPGIAWQFTTGDRIVSSPVLSEGTLFFGSNDGHVYALDAASGRQRWAWRTEGAVPSTPAVQDGRVHVLSYDGRLHTLDAATGAPLWTFATGGERRFEARGLHGSTPRTQTIADPYDVYLSSPAVVAGVLYFGSSDGHVYALDAASGAPRWKQRTGDVVHASPAVADGLVVVGSWDGSLYAFDALNGAARWRFQAGIDSLMANQQGFQSSAAIIGGVVYVGCRDAHLYAIDAATGKERWRFSTGASWVVGSPAVAHGRVYFATSDSARLHALDAQTGAPAWEQQTKAYQFASPVVAGDVLLTGLLNGTLEARDLAGGQALWTFRTEASQANVGWVLTADGRLNAPWIFHGGTQDAMVIGFDRQSSVGSFFSSALVAGGVIYVGSADGRMVALR